jgi:hypothetical protein
VAEVYESLSGAERPVEERRVLRPRLLSDQQESNTRAIIERCAGIDVGKTFVTVCVLIGAADAEPSSEKGCSAHSTRIYWHSAVG